MSRYLVKAALGLALGLATVPVAPVAMAAQQPPVRDAMAAPAGAYKLDKVHASVIARVPHAGFSYNTVRFGVIDGALTWDPAKIEASKLTVTVDMTPRTEPIVYVHDLRGPDYVNQVQFPTATFTSTSVRRTGPTTGVITGNLTFLGQTKPATIEAQLVGAGRNGRGVPTIGFSGLLKMKRDDWGLKYVMPGPMDAVEVELEGEFSIPPAA